MQVVEQGLSNLQQTLYVVKLENPHCLFAVNVESCKETAFVTSGYDQW